MPDCEAILKLIVSVCGCCCDVGEVEVVLAARGRKILVISSSNTATQTLAQKGNGE